MALSHQRTDKFSPEEFVGNLFRFSTGGLGDFAHGIFPRAREDGADARGVAKREQRLATDCRFPARIHFQNGFFQTRQITFQHGEVRFFGNLGNADRNAGIRVWEISGQIRDPRIKPLAGNGGQLVVLPPGLRYMMIRKDAAFADDETRSEKISANFRCVAFQRIHRVAIAVVERLAIAP